MKAHGITNSTPGGNGGRSTPASAPSTPGPGSARKKRKTGATTAVVAADDEITAPKDDEEDLKVEKGVKAEAKSAGARLNGASMSSLATIPDYRPYLALSAAAGAALAPGESPAVPTPTSAPKEGSSGQSASNDADDDVLLVYETQKRPVENATTASCPGQAVSSAAQQPTPPPQPMLQHSCEHHTNYGFPMSQPPLTLRTTTPSEPFAGYALPPMVDWYNSAQPSVYPFYHVVPKTENQWKSS